MSVEGEDQGTIITITGNTFTDNYNKNSHSPDKAVIATELYSVYKSQITELNTFSYTNTEVNVLPISYVSHSGIPQQTPSSTPIKTDANITDSSSIKNLYNIGFECPVDCGSITVYLTCKKNKCSISEGLYFIVKFEKQIIDDIEYDTRLMFPSTNPDKTLDNFVDRNKIIYNEENYSLSFNTGSENIVLNKAKTVNDLKCYVPFGGHNEQRRLHK